jgi:FixJ family two-component response regulator
MISAMAQTSPWIAVVDDDPSVLKALARLLGVHRLNTKTFVSARAFLDALPGGCPQCLIVDLQMPEMSGLELQQHLAGRRIRIPTIVITAHAERSARELCETAGACGFLCKPVNEQDLLSTVRRACMAM